MYDLFGAWLIERNTVNAMENKIECKIMLYCIYPQNCEQLLPVEPKHKFSLNFMDNI